MNKRLKPQKIQRQNPFPYIPRLLLYIMSLLVLPLGAEAGLTTESSGVDALMGRQGLASHQQRIEKLIFEKGQTYTWEEFSSWGREIFINGFVKKPPIGTGPSERVSQYFQCVTCHNFKREDPKLTVQDPEARFRWIEQTGEEIYLIQGATMWGVVNRETFYSDYYEIYHNLCVPKENVDRSSSCGPFLNICAPGCRTMDPSSLEDAIQVCSKYCSVGRYMADWELTALLAFFWDQEVRLMDLDLPPDQAARVKNVLNCTSTEPQEKEKLRRLISSRYARKANNTFRGIPTVEKDASQGDLVAQYPDGSRFGGDPARGERLYGLSCARCHGLYNMPQTASYLGGNLEEFYKMLAKGSRHSDRPYMPNFTLERLSRQQAADILMYLQQIMK